jgi:hypothetical protein
MPLPIVTAALGLAQLAPVIGRWIGGKNAEQAAQKIVTIAQDLTESLDPGTAILRLQENNKLMLDFQKAMIELDIQFEQMDIADRQDARARDIAIIKAGGSHARADIMVSEAVGIISTIAGIFGACLKDAYAFEFGSSRGSKEKDSTVAALLEHSK